MKVVEIIKYYSLVLLVFIAGCAEAEPHQQSVQEYFSKNKAGSSSDYAVVKNGEEYLIAVHGYWDDHAACLEIIELMNKGELLSPIPGNYACVPLNK